MIRDQEKARRKAMAENDPKIKNMFEMEAEQGSDNEENDHIVKNLSDSDSDNEDNDQDLQDLINNEKLQENSDDEADAY